LTPHTPPGRIEVITGPMFSGKSEELIRRLKRAQIARRRVICFKPDLDFRYHRTAIASHSSQTLDAVTVANVEALKATLFPQIDRIEVIGVDEAQFFDPSLVPLSLDLRHLGKRVILAASTPPSPASPSRRSPTCSPSPTRSSNYQRSACSAEPLPSTPRGSAPASRWFWSERPDFMRPAAVPASGPTATNRAPSSWNCPMSSAEDRLTAPSLTRHGCSRCDHRETAARAGPERSC
jgi:hypothetical protein